MIRRQRSKSPPTPPSAHPQPAMFWQTISATLMTPEKIPPTEIPRLQPGPKEWSGEQILICTHVCINIHSYSYFAQMFMGKFNDPTLIRVVTRCRHDAAASAAAVTPNRKCANVRMCTDSGDAGVQMCLQQRGFQSAALRRSATFLLGWTRRTPKSEMMKD